MPKRSLRGDAPKGACDTSILLEETVFSETPLTNLEWTHAAAPTSCWSCAIKQTEPKIVAKIEFKN
jgi:hypothetical protein